MRIAVVNNFFPPRVGGSSHLSESLAKEYVRAGHEVLVITAAFKDAPARERRDGLQIVRLPAWTLPSLGSAVDFDISFALGPRNMRRLNRALRDFAPDVIHQHGQFFDLTWMSGWYARRHRIPVLLSVHTRLESPQRLYGIVFAVLDRVLVRIVTRIYSPTFVVMDRLMDVYIRNRYRPAADHTVAIPVGVYTDHFAKGGDPAGLREQHGLVGKRVILSLGHVIPLRDRVALVEAMPAVLRRHPDAVLVVVGNVHFPAFQERARALGVEKNVVCTGAVPRAKIVDYLALAEVEAHDLQGYGLGTANLEAMAAGVPVVAAVREDNFPGIVLESGRNITLVRENDPDDLAKGLIGLLDDPAAAKAIAAAQQQLIEDHFSMRAITRLHLETLERLARNR